MDDCRDIHAVLEVSASLPSPDLVEYLNGCVCVICRVENLGLSQVQIGPIGGGSPFGFKETLLENHCHGAFHPDRLVVPLPLKNGIEIEHVPGSHIELP